MRLSQRGPWAAFLMLLILISPTALFAQSEDVTIAGSGIATPLLEDVLEAAETDFEYRLNITGSESGFEAFCTGEASVVTATEPMSLTAENICNNNGVNFGEVVLGYSAVAFVANPELDFLACMTPNEIGLALAPSSVQNATWADAISSAETETEIEAFLPGSNALSYFLADELLAGVGFRADAQTMEDDGAIIGAVGDAEGGIGLLNVSTLDNASDLLVISIRNNTIGQCVEPTSSNIGDGSYVAGFPLLAYVNTDALEGESALAEAMNALTDIELSDVIVEAGFVPPTDFDYTTNAEVVRGESVGRQFSRALTEFQIPPTVTGTIEIGGAADAFPVLDNFGTTFNQAYQGVTVNVNTLGEPTGIAALCNSELDMAATRGPVTDAARETCAEADIEVVDIEFGTQATVLLANEATDYLECLTTDEIVMVWGADSTETVTSWDGVNSDFPAEEFILFGGNPNNAIPNLMMQQAAGNSAPLRTDTEQDTDPLYRAAATANVETALTYMSWGQYQDVLDNEQERIQLVAVDSGDGCVTPSEETIRSGDYPLTRTIHLAVRQDALARMEVQSLLWYMFQDQSFRDLQRNNFDLITLKRLFDKRASLQEAFEAANTVAAEAAAAAAAEEATEAETDSQTDETDAE